MAVHPTDAAASGMGVHGLQFLNEDWNDSISNSDSFALRWNQSLAKLGIGLGVFKVTYPKNGVVYELVSNLTDKINVEGNSCQWTPNNLNKNLYAMWLTASQENNHPNWTLSPPWIPRDPSGNNASPRAAPFIPVVYLLGVYAASLNGYLVYRRRKKARREQDATPHQDAVRNDSVDSPVTVQALQDVGGGPEKRGVVIVNGSSDAKYTIRGAAGSASVHLSDFEHARSNTRRGRRGTAGSSGTGSISISRSDVKRARRNVCRRRSGTIDRHGNRNGSMDQSGTERGRSNVGRGRSGTNPRYGSRTGSIGQSGTERARANMRGTSERRGIRLVTDSGSGSDDEERFVPCRRHGEKGVHHTRNPTTRSAGRRGSDS